MASSSNQGTVELPKPTSEEIFRLDKKKEYMTQCDVIAKVCQSIEKYLKLKSEYDNQTKLVLMVDRLQLIILGAKISLDIMLDGNRPNDELLSVDDRDKIKATRDAISKVSDCFINELQSLQLDSA